VNEPARLSIGFPRMHKEPGERRDFLPPLVGLLAELGAEVYVEAGIGSGMGYSDSDYSSISQQSTSRTRTPPTTRTWSSSSGRPRAGTSACTAAPS